MHRLGVGAKEYFWVVNQKKLSVWFHTDGVFSFWIKIPHVMDVRIVVDFPVLPGGTPPPPLVSCVYTSSSQLLPECFCRRWMVNPIQNELLKGGKKQTVLTIFLKKILHTISQAYAQRDTNVLLTRSNVIIGGGGGHKAAWDKHIPDVVKRCDMQSVGASVYRENKGSFEWSFSGNKMKILRPENTRPRPCLALRSAYEWRYIRNRQLGSTLATSPCVHLTIF